MCTCLVTESCSTICDCMDCSPPGPCHGILQARTLEWVVISFFRGSSWPKFQTQFSCIAGEFFTIWATREDWMNLEISATGSNASDRLWKNSFWNARGLCSNGGLGLAWWLSGKESACQWRRHGLDPWVGKRLWRRIWQNTLISTPPPRRIHGQRSLVAYGSMGFKRVR